MYRAKSDLLAGILSIAVWTLTMAAEGQVLNLDKRAENKLISFGWDNPSLSDFKAGLRFGGHRKGKRGRGAAGKVAVVGLLKRGGRVYTQMIADCRKDTLLPIIRRRVWCGPVR